MTLLFGKPRVWILSCRDWFGSLMRLAKAIVASFRRRSAMSFAAVKSINIDPAIFLAEYLYILNFLGEKGNLI